MRFFIFYLFVVIVAILLVYLYRNRENYDYDAENPNALRTGYNVAGTVYASYPGNVPGLGWIL
jgi:hypothetical protein